MLTPKKCFKKLGSQEPEPEPAPGKKIPKPPQNMLAPKPWPQLCYQFLYLNISQVPGLEEIQKVFLFLLLHIVP